MHNSSNISSLDLFNKSLRRINQNYYYHLPPVINSTNLILLFDLGIFKLSHDEEKKKEIILIILNSAGEWIMNEHEIINKKQIELF